MKFYEIDTRVEELLLALVDEDGVINEEAERELAELELADTEKTEGVLLAIKGMAAEAEAIRNEEKALADRRRVIEKKAAGLKAFIQRRLAGEKFRTPRVAVSYRKTTSCEVDDGAWIFWPEELQDQLTKQTTTVDKAAVKALLKDGRQIDGARLVTSQSMTIK